MVERTGLGYLCLSKRGGVPRMCVGAVMWWKESGFFSRSFINDRDVEFMCPYWGCVLWSNRLGWLVVPQ